MASIKTYLWPLGIAACLFGLYLVFSSVSGAIAKRDTALVESGKQIVAQMVNTATIAQQAKHAGQADAGLYVWAGTVNDIYTGTHDFLQNITEVQNVTPLIQTNATQQTAAPSSVLPYYLNYALCLRYQKEKSRNLASGNSNQPATTSSTTAKTPPSPASGCERVEQLTIVQLVTWAGLLIEHGSLAEADKASIKGLYE